MEKMNKREVIILLVILLVGFFFRLHNLASIPPGFYPEEALNGNQAVIASELHRFVPPFDGIAEGLWINLTAILFQLFGIGLWSLRLLPALFGIATILGLYLLARELFEWRLASIASFLLAVSFWHVNFSRMSITDMLAPFAFVFGAYFFWAGIKKIYLVDFVYAGLFFGLGLYAHLSFWLMPLVLLLVLWGYRRAIKKDFSHEKYEYAIKQVVRGMEIMILISAVVALPLLIYLTVNPEILSAKINQVSVFNSLNPIKDIAVNTFKTLGMFNFYGDNDWRHGIAGEPLLFWPVGFLFLVGFIRSWRKLFKIYHSHGHLSTVQILLLSWFLIGLVPAVFGGNAPNALLAIMVAPVVMIFSAEGIWWVYETIDSWHGERDKHQVRFSFVRISEHALISSVAIIGLMTAIGLSEYYRYFYSWAVNPLTASAFHQNYTKLGQDINAMDIRSRKYILVNTNEKLINGLPESAQTLMFITDTATPEKQEAKNIFYLTSGQYQQRQYDKRSIIIPLVPLR